MRPTVYLETSVIGYLASRPSRDIMVAAQQEATRLWWADRRREYRLLIAEPVWREVSRGDPEAAAERRVFLEGIESLPLTVAAEKLAAALLAGAGLPRKAAVDALHIAIAAVGGADYLLTWNCTHIANAVFRPRLESMCRAAGHAPPTICTPMELL